MSVKALAQAFREKYNLPDTWEPYEFKSIPAPDYTHIQVTGCLTSTFVKGPKKGKKKYTGEGVRTFIFSNEEYNQFLKA